MTGLTLPGMIEEPGLQVGDVQLAEARVRARAHPADVVVDLGEETAIVRRAPDASTRPSRLACASKWSFASVIGSSVSAAMQLDDLLREAERAC